jgi:hypothetical protein
LQNSTGHVKKTKGSKKQGGIATMPEKISFKQLSQTFRGQEIAIDLEDTSCPEKSCYLQGKCTSIQAYHTGFIFELESGKQQPIIPESITENVLKGRLKHSQQTIRIMLVESQPEEKDYSHIEDPSDCRCIK